MFWFSSKMELPGYESLCLFFISTKVFFIFAVRQIWCAQCWFNCNWYSGKVVKCHKLIWNYKNFMKSKLFLVCEDLLQLEKKCQIGETSTDACQMFIHICIKSSVKLKVPLFISHKVWDCMHHPILKLKQQQKLKHHINSLFLGKRNPQL